MLRRMSINTMLCLLVWTGVSTAATGYRFITLDVPFPKQEDQGCSGVNNAIQLVGLYRDDLGQDQGYRWDGTRLELLPRLTPRTLNNAGHFTGWFFDARLYGFVHFLDRFRQLYVDSSLAYYLEGIGMNDQGEVVGDFYGSEGKFHSFLWRNGTFQDITPNFITAWGCGASAINADGEVVGACDTYGYLDRGGVFTRLDFPGADGTFPSAINADTIAGTYCQRDVCHGFTFNDQGWQAVDVPNATLTQIYAMNDQGDLCGRYLDASGHNHGFLAVALARRGQANGVADVLRGFASARR
jgi:probable HAF family extracellular repeat protein